MSIGLAGIEVGTILALLLAPVVVNHYGWQVNFYAFGALGFVWCVASSRLLSSTPQSHPRISDAEVALIACDGHDGRKRSEETALAAAKGIDWVQMLKHSPSFWGVLCAHVCFTAWVHMSGNWQGPDAAHLSLPFEGQIWRPPEGWRFGFAGRGVLPGYL